MHAHTEQWYHTNYLLALYDILPLTYPTLLTGDIIIYCTKNRVPNWLFSFPFHLRTDNPLRLESLLSHIKICTHTKSNVYLSNSLATALSDHGLERISTIYAPHLKTFSSVYVVPNFQSNSEVLQNVSEYGTFYGEDFVAV